MLSFSSDGADILRPAKSLEAVAADPRAAASFACVPYFGRLPRGLDFAGRHWPLAPTLPACDPASALHGEGWVSQWSVAAQSGHTARLCFTHKGGSPGQFPFAYEAEQQISLSEAGLSVTLRIRNIAPEAAPAGLGLHPYFPWTPQTRLKIRAGRFWTPPSGGAGAEGPIPADRDFSRGARLPAETLDHSYVDVKSPIEVHDGERRILIATDAPHIHVYALAGADFFCIEPVTHLPGRFGGQVLEPGASMALQMILAAERA